MKIHKDYVYNVKEYSHMDKRDENHLRLDYDVIVTKVTDKFVEGYVIASRKQKMQDTFNVFRNSKWRVFTEIGPKEEYPEYFI